MNILPEYHHHHMDYSLKIVIIVIRLAYFFYSCNKHAYGSLVIYIISSPMEISFEVLCVEQSGVAYGSKRGHMGAG